MAERIIDPAVRAGESKTESGLRPLSFDAYIGQERVKENLRIFVKAAVARGEALDHVLLSGPPGLGKTTLAHIIAHELGVELHITSGPALEKKGDLAGLLSALEEGDLLFIDEIHRLNMVVEENLYPAMEDLRFDVIIGQGVYARSFPMQLKPFTLVGATTRSGLLSSPMRDRFGIVERLDFYSSEALSEIILRSAKVLEIPIRLEAARCLSTRCRGTPRVANRLLRRIRDIAQVRGEGIVDLEMAQEALKLLDVDDQGFDRMDRRLLLCLIDRFGGGPVGLDTLAASIGEEKQTVEDVYEPYLLQEGFIKRTHRGRMAMPKAYLHLQQPMGTLL